MATVSLTAFGTLCLVGGPLPMDDILVYRAEGEAVLNGTDLYGFTVTGWDLPATYPPFAALLFVPAAVLPLGAVKILSVLANLALLALLVRQSARLAGRSRPYGVPVLLAATGAALWLEPVFQTVVFGQVNLALACLVLWDLNRPDGARGKGFAIGLAAGIKLTPAIFAVYLLLTGRARAALTALGGFAATVVVGACALPGLRENSVEFWTRRLFETTRVGKPWIVDNQSLQGLAARLLHTPDPGLLWLLPAAVAAGAGLWLARRAYVRHGLESWGVLATAFTALLVSPVSWSHHWVWCVPLLAVLLTGRAPYWVTGAVALVFTARTLWLLPKAGDLDLRFAWWQQPLASPYGVLGLVLAAALAWQLRPRPPSSTAVRRADSSPPGATS
ncbi:DUF2029 domain-containing protein [Streptomyces armeniacus]|uniref:DUF2029 domain-containing protein n=1 Tax=Streptomyces armeniacus TaxID=83291 RepID=A0A345XZR5_9ACTN|nr:glycosyltransferase 87 family protein [Streptomyces armeniacus]AXK37131.1 DUF2029 domain-containing protein [Streptomyces armeniacus]